MKPMPAFQFCGPSPLLRTRWTHYLNLSFSLFYLFFTDPVYWAIIPVPAPLHVAIICILTKSNNPQNFTKKRIHMISPTIFSKSFTWKSRGRFGYLFLPVILLTGGYADYFFPVGRTFGQCICLEAI